MPRRELTEAEAERIVERREWFEREPEPEPVDPRMPGGRLWPWHVDGPVQS